MNIQPHATICDPDRLEQFLSGRLNDGEERDLLLHLETCDACRRELDRQAAEPESWREAEQLLKPVAFDSTSAENSPARRQPLEIQIVVDALGPTDDPAMLGRLGGYEISGVVGAGGMGVVLKAVDRSLDRTVAIKVLSPYLATSGAARRRFAREAKAAAAVLHPNVIAIHSVSNDESLPYLVMPYVRGASLQRRLDREGPLPLAEVLRIGAQIAAGLAAAHAQGLVHRDIKPANILLEEGIERVTITDFGLARAVDDATITHSGVAAGTPQYMSPEQARGESLDQRSDLFSLGSVLYAVCTGRAPFRADTTYGVLRRITDDEPASIREINPEIPEWLSGIIARLMQKKASDRYQSAAEVADLLAACLAHVQQPAAVPLPESLAASAMGRWNWSPFGKGAGVMLAIVAILVLGFGLWQISAPPDIGGEWHGADWGDVVLKKTADAEYEGSYTDTFGNTPGKLRLQWSRMEGRYHGTWSEGEDRFGELSVRLVGEEIRGAHTTDAKSKINPANPRLADLAWQRGPQMRKTTTPQTDRAVPSPRFAKQWRLAMPQGVQAVAIAPDGKRMAVANGNPDYPRHGRKRWVAMLDLAEPKIQFPFELETKEETDALASLADLRDFEQTPLAISPDGKILAIGTGLGQVKLFDTATGKRLRALDDEQGKKADDQAPEKVRSIPRAMGTVEAMAFSPDGKTLAIVGKSFTDSAREWGGLERLTRRVTGPGRVKLWDVETGRLQSDLTAHSEALALAWSSDGSLLATAGRWNEEVSNGTGVFVWNPPLGRTASTLSVDSNGFTYGVTFSPAAKLLAMATTSYDKQKDTYSSELGVIYALSGVTEWKRTFTGSAYPKAFSPDGKWLAVLGREGIRFFETSSGRELEELRTADHSPGGRWTDLAIAREGGRLAVSSSDPGDKGSIWVFELPKQKEPAQEKPAAERKK